MSATQPEIPYDVFISYCHADQDWVWGWLVPRLKDAGLEICIDQESFELGFPAVTNMENAVETSRHTLLVLTPAYLASEWAMYEQILTQTQDPFGLRQRTIPVLREPCDLPKRIAALTYADLTGKRDEKAELVKIVRACGGTPQPPQSSRAAHQISKLWAQEMKAWGEINHGEKTSELVRNAASLNGNNLSLDDRLGLFREFLGRYLGYLNYNQQSLEDADKAIQICLGQFVGHRNEHVDNKGIADEAYDLTNRFTSELCQLVLNTRSEDLYRALAAISREACEIFTDKKWAAPETIWFSRLFRAAEVIRFDLEPTSKSASKDGLLKKGEYCRLPDDVEFLWAFVKDVFSRIRPNGEDVVWATEFYACYLERLARLCEDLKDNEGSAQFMMHAGVESMEAALLKKNLANKDQDKEIAATFAAALFARAGQCFSSTHTHECLAERCYGWAIGEMLSVTPSVGGQPSIRSVCERQDVESIIRGKVPSKLLDMDGGGEPRVALVSNAWDRVFAFWLAARFAEEGITPKLIDSRTANPETIARYCVGTVIVGDSRAPTTDKFLKRHPAILFTRSEKLNLTLEELALKPTRRYNDVWSLDSPDEHPLLVVAGGTREDTCCAVVEFARGDAKRARDGKSVFEVFAGRIRS